MPPSVPAAGKIFTIILQVAPGAKDVPQLLVGAVPIVAVEAGNVSLFRSECSLASKQPVCYL